MVTVLLKKRKKTRAASGGWCGANEWKKELDRESTSDTVRGRRTNDDDDDRTGARVCVNRRVPFDCSARGAIPVRARGTAPRRRKQRRTTDGTCRVTRRPVAAAAATIAATIGRRDTLRARQAQKAPVHGRRQHCSGGKSPPRSCLPARRQPARARHRRTSVTIVRGRSRLPPPPPTTLTGRTSIRTRGHVRPHPSRPQPCFYPPTIRVKTGGTCIYYYYY